MNSTIILILLILAAFFLGWLISRLLNKGGSSDDGGLSLQISEREAELEACRKHNASLSAKAAAAKSIAAEVVAPVVAAPIVEAVAAAPIANTFVDNRVDDLKIVEGIGPKIEELFNNAGIKTFAQLASTSVERLNEILEAAGPRYQMHDPSTWPQQSDLANKGQWTELKVLQDELNKGKVD
jgi:predicted flap endonuclease-1-like 5' DNA nuclease